MDWGSVLAITAAVVFFGAIMYEALKEPIDLILSGIANLFGKVTSKGSDAVVGEVITYG